MKCDECRHLVDSTDNRFEVELCVKRNCFPDPNIEKDCADFRPTDRLLKLRRLPADKITDLLIYPIEKHGNTFFLTRDEEVYASYNEAYEHTTKWLLEAPDKDSFY